MLSAITAAVVPLVIKGAISAFERYQKGEITREQLDAEVKQTMVDALAEVEKAWAQAASEQFAAFMAATQKSRLIQIGWSLVLVSQLGVLLWHQVGIPAYVHFTGDPYPSSGTTVEWAYLLVGGCIGVGPLVFRSGAKTGDVIRKIAGRQD